MAWQALVATLAATVGAGFASGREVYVFFGANGTWAVGLGSAATLLLMVAAWCTVSKGRKAADPLEALFGRYKAAGRVTLGLFSLLTLSAVIAVLGSLGRDELGLPTWLGALAAAVAAGALAGGGMGRQRVAQAIMLAAVAGFVSVAAAGALTLPAPPIPRPGGSTWRMLSAAWGYVAYNIALATDGIARSSRGSKHAGLAAAGGGLIAGLLLTLEAAALARHGALVGGRDLPLLALATALHGGLGHAFAAAIALAGVSASASFATAAGAMLHGQWRAAAAGLALSAFGVQGLVDRAYPWMAATAAAWLVVLLWPARRGRTAP